MLQGSLFQGLITSELVSSSMHRTGPKMGWHGEPSRKAFETDCSCACSCSQPTLSCSSVEPMSY